MSFEVVQLYRQYLRQVRKLPDEYLRVFFRIKGGDDFRVVASTTDSSRRAKKLKRAIQITRKLEAANGHEHTAFTHILDLAYGRKGKLRWELMEPILNDTNTPLPAPIIAKEEDSRPPVYSPKLKALLLSPHSRLRTGRTPTSNSFLIPPTMPERADPKSMQAKQLGVLSKRRQVNIHWRYYAFEHKRVLPPMQLERNGDAKLGIFASLQKLAGPAWTPKPITRKARQADPTVPSPVVSRPEMPTRWLRRRYRDLLARVPILTYSPDDTVHGQGKYSVSIADNVAAHNRLPQVDEAELAWINHSGEHSVKLKTKKRRVKI